MTASARMRRRAVATIARRTGTLTAPLILAALRLTSKRAGIVLLYHGVDTRDGDPKRELVPPIARERFRRQLRHISRHYRPVALTELPAAVAARRRGQRFPVAVTFDDDLAEHERHALPLLAECGVPATFFLCGSFLDPAAPDFWWVRLQRAHDAGADLTGLLPGAPTDLSNLAWQIQHLPLGERDALARRLADLAGPDEPERRLTRQGAERLLQAGHAVGFHTRHHPALTTLDEDELRTALSEGREELARFSGRPVDALSFPHGAWDERVAAGTRAAGFRLGLTTRREPVTPETDPVLMGRHAPLGRTPGEFAFELLGPIRAA